MMDSDGQVKAAYVYSALRTPTSVRVLEVADHDPTKPIHLRIRQIDLDDEPCPEFRCISYTWGNPFTQKHPSGQLDPARWDAKHPVLLSDTESDEPRLGSVTTNLQHFLLQLRASPEGSKTAVPIWIDALCINQSDLQERAHEVNLMGRIYTSCTESLIWLGEETGEARTIFHMMHGLSKIPDADWTAIDETWYLVQPEQLTRITNLLEAYSVPFRDVHDDLLSFFSRTWFHRIWTIQECKLPATLQLWCGALRAPDFEVLDRLAFVLDKCFNCLYPMEKDTTRQSQKRLMVDRDVDPIEHYFRRFVFRSPREAMQGVKARHRRQTHTLEQCMTRARQKQCTDPRDRVYGLLGMQERPVVKADYVCGVEELYARVTELEFGEFFRMREDDAVRNFENLPSWVPDWSARLEPNMWMDRGGNAMYCAGSVDEGGRMPVRICEGVLETEGFDADIVGKLGGTHTETISGEGMLLSLRLVRDAHSSLPEAPGLVERFWRTTIADLPGSGCWHPRAEKHGPAFAVLCLDLLANCIRRSGYDAGLQSEVESILADLLRLDLKAHLPSWQQVSDAAKGALKVDVFTDDDGETNPYGSSLDRMFQLRRFFITKHGRMGIASQSAQEGDTIVIVKNVHYPFLMRKLASGRYRYLSLAYIDGIMQGEALHSNTFGKIAIE